MKSKYSIDLFDENDVKNSMSTFPEKENAYITETAGFVPLEVKMKQFEQNGLIAQFQVKDFDSNDYRDMYLNPDFNITPEDDIEDIEEKLAMQRDFISNLKKEKSDDKKEKAKSDGQSDKAGTEEPEKQEKPKENTAADK